MASSPDVMAIHLAFFQMTFSDPDLRRLTLAALTSNERAVVDLLRGALEAGKLGGLEPEALAPNRPPGVLAQLGDLSEAHGSGMGAAPNRHGPRAVPGRGERRHPRMIRGSTIW